MIPILYEKDETAFTSAGLASLTECIECTVEEDLDGMYELKMVYPTTGLHFDLLTEGRIIGAAHDDNGDVQPFEIYKISGQMDGRVTYNARHISYKLNTAVVIPSALGMALNFEDALIYIKNNSIDVANFSFATDILSPALQGIYIFNKAVPVRSLLVKNSPMYTAFGGAEATFDKYSVFVQRRRGRDTGVEIRYGKNLKDLNQDRDSGDTYNAMVPFWVSKGGIPYAIATDPKYVVHGSPDTIKAVPVDLSSDFETQPTDAEMRTAASAKLEASLAWMASESIKVDFVALWQTEEYKDYADLQRVSLGDTVNVYYPELGIVANGQRVVKTVYDTLRERFTEITLNELQPTLFDTTETQITDTLASEAKTLEVRTTKSGTVTTDANGVADISSLVVAGGVPVSGIADNLNAYIMIGSDGAGLFAARVIDNAGDPIASTSITLTIYSMR